RARLRRPVLGSGAHAVGDFAVSLLRRVRDARRRAAPARGRPRARRILRSVDRRRAGRVRAKRLVGTDGGKPGLYHPLHPTATYPLRIADCGFRIDNSTQSKMNNPQSAFRIPKLTVAIVAAVLAHPAAQARVHRLESTPDTVAYGYYWSEAKPALHIASG